MSNADTLTDSQPSEDVDESAMRRVGRFVILRKLGAGGMGSVHLAYDEELDRKVAIKLLRQGVGQEAHARVEREAKAMAKLSHPNVLAVYDVGREDERVYIAMQYMSGETLDMWCRAPARSWREILDAYRQAGEGLAAAHAAGLVHRDFKPQNVMVQPRESGGIEVKVLDFGLARRDEDAPMDPELLEISGPSGDDLDPKLTAAGSVMGTPAYMAPEQFVSADVDAQADQFSFCVSLWESLFGERPYRGTSVPEIFSAVAEGRRRPPPPGAKVSDRVTHALERGLEPTPADRWPSMRGLLDALRLEPPTSGNRWLGAGAVVGLGGLAFGAHAWWSDRAERCTGAAEQLSDTWNQTRREGIHSAMLSTGAPFAPQTWETTAEALDGYAAHWRYMYTEACEATAIREEQSSELLELRMACLQRAEVGLAAVTDILATGDREVLAKAHDVVDQLPPLDRCADIEALRSDNVVAPNREEVEAVNAARGLIARADAEFAAGRHADSKRLIDTAGEELEEIAYSPVLAEAGRVRGRVLSALGEYEQAERTLTAALEQASSSEHRELMFALSIELMYVIGAFQHRFDAALQFAPLAKGLARTRDERAFFAHTHGLVLSSAGQLLDAEAQARRAVELSEASSDRSKLARSLAALATTLRKQGKYDGAEPHLRRAIALTEAKLGPLHPQVADARNTLANVLADAGRYDESESELLRVLETRRAALGPDHHKVARSLNNLARVYKAQRRFDDAEARYKEALAIKEKALAVDHPSVAVTLNNLANLLQDRDRLEEAEALHRRALEIRERILPPDHPGLASSRSNLALLLLDRDQAEQALELAELAWARRNRDDTPPGHRGNTAMAIARALWDLDRNPQRARTMAERAREDFEKALPAYADELAKLEAQMRARGLD